MPLRSFGSVSKAELLKYIWVPVTYATDPQVIGFHTGGLINSAGDQARIELKVPPPAHVGYIHIAIQYIGNINDLNMHVDLDMDWGAPIQAYNTHTFSAAQLHWPSAANQIRQYIIPEANFATLDTTDLLGIRVLYQLAATASDLYVLGAVLSWD